MSVMPIIQFLLRAQLTSISKWPLRKIYAALCGVKLGYLVGKTAQGKPHMSMRYGICQNSLFERVFQFKRVHCIKNLREGR
jgi:hypothetical protein